MIMRHALARLGRGGAARSVVQSAPPTRTAQRTWSTSSSSSSSSPSSSSSSKTTLSAAAGAASGAAMEQDQMPVSASLLLQKRQRGEEFSASEMRWFVDSCVEMRPEVLGPEQASALLMAMSLSESNGGLTTQETVYMAQAIADSGAKVKLPDDEPSVSLYSGVGDKTSLIVVPVCASCGIKVPKISDRGFIGGIVDKLECIPGFRVKMPEQDFVQIVEEVNAAIVAPFPDIVPADEPLRRIRELLYISENLPLMAASVVGKKLAGGTSSFLFDVKTGSGTALADVNAAVSFAQKLVVAARGTERSASAFVTSMHQPLGYAIGSYLELVECLQILNGQHTRTGNLRDISFLLSAQVLLQAGKCSTLEEGYNMAVESITSGRAMESFRKMVEAQGGDLEFIAKALEPGPSPYTVERRIEVRVEPGDLEHIESELPVDSTIDDATRIVGIDTIVLGELSKKLGAFRSVASDNIDFGSGIELQRSLSEAVHPGDILCTLYTNNARTSDADLCKAARKAFSFERGPVSAQPLIFAFIDGEGGVTNL